tara:strand:+ start:319 stop:756 length:438 start_codon:yes stop_codon:yes gene_type:complete
MKTENKKTEAAAPKTIDMTPTWEATLQTCLILVERGNQEGRANAIAELKRMAKLADLYVQSQKEPEPEPEPTKWIIEATSAATEGTLCMGRGDTEEEAWIDACGPKPWSKWIKSCNEGRWSKEVTLAELEAIDDARAETGHEYQS